MGEKKNQEPAAEIDPIDCLLSLDGAKIDERIASQKAVCIAEEGKLRQLLLIRKSIAFRNGEIKRRCVRKKKDRTAESSAQASDSPQKGVGLQDRLLAHLKGRDYTRIAVLSTAWNVPANELLHVIRSAPSLFILDTVGGAQSVKLAE
jgi:hypothetical protein